MARRPKAAGAGLDFFLNRFRKQRAPSAALTQISYAQASIGDMNGKGLTALLALEDVHGRPEVREAMQAFVRDHHLKRATWSDVIEAVRGSVGSGAADQLQHLLDGRWQPTLALEDGRLMVDDTPDPLRAVPSRVVVVNDRYEKLVDCAVTLGSGRVEACVPPDDWAHAFLDPRLPIEGRRAYLSRR